MNRIDAMRFVCESRELNSAELDRVAAGMSCRTALAVYSVYMVTADIMRALDNQAGRLEFASRAAGVLEGACHPG